LTVYSADLDGTPTSAKIIWSSVGIGLLLIIITALAIVKWQKGKKRKSNYLVNSEVSRDLSCFACFPAVLSFFLSFI